MKSRNVNIHSSKREGTTCLPPNMCIDSMMRHWKGGRNCGRWKHKEGRICTDTNTKTRNLLRRRRRPVGCHMCSDRYHFSAFTRKKNQPSPALDLRIRRGKEWQEWGLPLLIKYLEGRKSIRITAPPQSGEFSLF